MTMRNQIAHSTTIRMLIAGAAVVASVFLGVTQGQASATAQGDTSWTVYHGDPSGTGVSSALKSVVTAKRAWASR